MIHAIYKRREDGDYDFVAAFETEQLPPPPSDWPQEITDWLNAEGELPLAVKDIPLDKLPDVLEMGEPMTVTTEATVTFKAANKRRMTRLMEELFERLPEGVEMEIGLPENK